MPLLGFPAVPDNLVYISKIFSPLVNWVGNVNSGILKCPQGKEVESLPMLERAFAICEGKLDEMHPLRCGILWKLRMARHMARQGAFAMNLLQQQRRLVSCMGLHYLYWRMHRARADLLDMEADDISVVNFRNCFGSACLG